MKQIKLIRMREEKYMKKNYYAIKIGNNVKDLIVDLSLIHI